MRKLSYRQVCITNVRGFTLIELLVVIAIIGILASIVLVSLSSARTRGADAGVQGNLNTIRTQAELYYSDNGTYGLFNSGSASALSNNQSTGLCFTQTSGVVAGLNPVAVSPAKPPKSVPQVPAVMRSLPVRQRIYTDQVPLSVPSNFNVSESSVPEMPLPSP